MRNKECVRHDYSKADIELLENFIEDDHMHLGMFSEQVPGSVYTESFHRKGHHYYWHVEDDVKMDVTYVVYRLLVEGKWGS